LHYLPLRQNLWQLVMQEKWSSSFEASCGILAYNNKQPQFSMMTTMLQ
jgi:hypothetical protein